MVLATMLCYLSQLRNQPYPSSVKRQISVPKPTGVARNSSFPTKQKFRNFIT